MSLTFMGRQEHKNMCIGMSMEPKHLCHMEESWHSIMRYKMPRIPDPLRRQLYTNMHGTMSGTISFSTIRYIYRWHQPTMRPNVPQRVQVPKAGDDLRFLMLEHSSNVILLPREFKLLNRLSWRVLRRPKQTTMLTNVSVNSGLLLSWDQ